MRKKMSSAIFLKIFLDWKIYFEKFFRLKDFGIYFEKNFCRETFFVDKFFFIF